MPQVQKQKVKGCKKCDRNKKKKARAGSPISLFVKNKISANEYWKLTQQKFRND